MQFIFSKLKTIHNKHVYVFRNFKVYWHELEINWIPNKVHWSYILYDMNEMWWWCAILLNINVILIAFAIQQYKVHIGTFPLALISMHVHINRSFKWTQGRHTFFFTKFLFLFLFFQKLKLIIWLCLLAVPFDCISSQHTHTQHV